MNSRAHAFKAAYVITVITAIALLLSGCSSSKQISVKTINKITSTPFYEWTVDDCNTIIGLSTVSNKEQYISGTLAYQITGYDVFISAMPLTEMTIKAITRKEALLKRLTDSEYEMLLKDYFNTYTNYNYNSETKKLELKTVIEDPIKGLTFQVVFQNITDPYHPIILDEGYDYFFLENEKGEYARVAEVSGRFAETDFYLTDYLKVYITFNAKSVDNKFLFKDRLSVTNFKLIFNGLEDDPIVLDWKLLNNNGGAK